MPATYFLGTRLLGSTHEPSWWSDAQISATNSAFVCPKCGNLWGRVLISQNADWHPVTRPCAQHPYSSDDDSAGSFIAPWRGTLAGFPPEVLLYELTLRLERFRNEQS